MQLNFVYQPWNSNQATYLKENFLSESDFLYSAKKTSSQKSRCRSENQGCEFVLIRICIKNGDRNVLEDQLCTVLNAFFPLKRRALTKSSRWIKITQLSD